LSAKVCRIEDEMFVGHNVEVINDSYRRATRNGRRVQTGWNVRVIL